MRRTIEPTVRERAFALRAEGHSYSHIAMVTGLSKSTLSAWLAEIPYEPNTETTHRIGLARSRAGRTQHLRKRASLEEARLLAKKDVGTLSDRDLFMVGVGLYLGEGSKSIENIRIVNADPRIIVLGVHWLTRICGLSLKNFSMTIHMYPDNDEKECLRHWSLVTSIPLEQFKKSQVDERVDKLAKKKGKCKYGTAHLSVVSHGEKRFGVFLFRRIAGWMEEVYNQTVQIKRV